MVSSTVFVILEIALILQLFSKLIVLAQDGDDLEVSWRSIDLDNGRRRRVLEFIPENIEQQPALVVLLHGMGGRPSALIGGSTPTFRYLLESANEKGFVVIAPEAEPMNLFGFIKLPFFRAWNDNEIGKWWRYPDADDVGFVTTIIDLAVQDLNVDPNRVFISGLSGGGRMLYRLLHEHSDLFAASAALLTLLPRDYPAPGNNFVPSPLMSYAGTEDSIFPFNGGNSMYFNSRSFEDTLSYVAALNGIDTTNTGGATSALIRSPNGCRVDVTEYASGTAPVVGYGVFAGHIITGTDRLFFSRLFDWLTRKEDACNADFDFMPLLVDFFVQFGL